MAECSADYLVPESQFTKAWLEKILQPRLKTNASLVSAISQRIGTDSGHLAFVMKVSLEWMPYDDSLPYTVILKAPSNDIIESSSKETTELDTNFVYEAHNNECVFYEIVQNEDIPAKISRSYFQQKVTKSQPGVLVFQEIQGITPGYFHRLNLEQAQNAVGELAHLHAWSLLHPSKWKGKLKCPSDSVFEGMAPYVQCLFAQFRSIWPDKLKNIPEGITDKMDRHMFDYLYRAVEDMGMTPVLGHGDFWEGNIMFHKDTASSGNAIGNTVSAIYDFQIAMEAVPGEDIARLLWSSVSTEMRRNRSAEILRQYYSVLQTDLQGDPPFSFQDLQESYNYAGLCAASSCLLSNISFAVKVNEGEEDEKKKILPEFVDNIAEVIDDFIPLLLNKESMIAKYRK